MDIEQLQEIINVLNNKLANANLQHAVTETELNKAKRQIIDLEEKLEASHSPKAENKKVTVDHVEK